MTLEKIIFKFTTGTWYVLWFAVSFLVLLCVYLATTRRSQKNRAFQVPKGFVERWVSSYLNLEQNGSYSVEVIGCDSENDLCSSKPFRDHHRGPKDGEDPNGFAQ